MPTQHAHSEALFRIVCIPEPSVGEIKQRTAPNADPGSQPSTLPLVLCKDPSWGWMLSLPFFYHDFQRLIFMYVFASVSTCVWVPVVSSVSTSRPHTAHLWLPIAHILEPHQPDVTYEATCITCDAFVCPLHV